jgi:pimeloyl-ACP methyl ester carboxylesterase
VHVILVPGFWLDASSWDALTPALRAAGHTPHALTLPGLETQDADRSAITLADHIEAVLHAIDEVGEPLAIVAHSGGGPISYAAAAQRSGIVDRFVFVDTFPLPTGGVINDELPEEHGEIVLPPKDFWPENEVAGFDDEGWAAFAAVAKPEPAAVAAGEFDLAGADARGVPATVIATSYPEASIREYAEAPFMSELFAMTDVTFVDLDTGHWPQFTKPAELAEIVVRALA